MNKWEKLRYKLLSNRIVFLLLICAGILSLVLALKSESVKTQASKINNNPTPVTKQVIAKTPQPSFIPTPKPSTLIPNPTPSLTSKPTPSTTPQQPTSTVHNNQVNVSINGTSNFNVLVQEGANQCDVLSKALSDEKISSLNMKYNDTYKTYGVYQINGIGKEGQIWWTYSVNGKNPPLGCSLVKANNNDNVVWTYTGPN